MSETNTLHEGNYAMIRKFHGFTQQELAQKVGVSQAMVALVENGTAKLPDKMRRRTVRRLKLTPEKIDSITLLNEDYLAAKGRILAM